MHQRRLVLIKVAWYLLGMWFVGQMRAAPVDETRFITLAPGHFHAALVYKDRLPGVSDQVQVYAPLDRDLLAYLGRMAQFNARSASPTHWDLEVHAGPGYWERLLQEKRGNVVVLSGNNRRKIDRIQALLAAGFHVLADKPWIVEPEELPQLQAAITTARRQDLIAFDAMTQRFEISCLLTRELVNAPAVFGQAVRGTPEQPAVRMESVHYLLKEVAGTPLQRPPWFFDIRQQGEGLTDVGTHLVDLAQWILLPDQAIDYQRDLQILRASRWPTRLAQTAFQRITGDAEFPAELKASINQGALEYYANNRVLYTQQGVHIQLEVRWELEAPPGTKDTELAIFQGSRSRVEVRQGQEQRFRPEIYVIPHISELKPAIREALSHHLDQLQSRYPGVAFEEESGQFHLVIPDRLRVDHEAHFALLVQQFLRYYRQPSSLPAWEMPNLIAKYYITTQGVKLARQTGP